MVGSSLEVQRVKDLALSLQRLQSLLLCCGLDSLAQKFPHASSAAKKTNKKIKPTVNKLIMETYASHLTTIVFHSLIKGNFSNFRF